MIIKDGVRKDENGKYRFDKKVDLDTDIIELTKDISGEKVANNLRYFYAYEFKNDTTPRQQKEFRDALKYNIENTDYFYTEEVADFVEDGVFRLDEYKRLDKFKVLVSVKPTFTGSNTLLDWIEIYINEYSSTGIISFELLKKLISEVTFDKRKAYESLRNTTKYGRYSDNELKNIVNKVAIKFNKADPNKIFAIKEYLPVALREGFINYLKFKDEETEQLYRNLDAGTEVLIVDDFITSGSTLKEIIRFLNAVNPNNKITAFAFLNQLREY